MNKSTASAIVTLCVSTLLVGCVTVNLGGPKGGKRASGVTFIAPPAPFEKDGRDDVDAAWKNGRNGNVISYLSDCKDPSDPTLDTIISGVLSGLNDLHFESQRDLTFGGRGARRSLATGKVDGVPTKIDLLVFKRNQCIYVLNYIGVLPAFGENTREFERFLAEFRAP